MVKKDLTNNFGIANHVGSVLKEINKQVNALGIPSFSVKKRNSKELLNDLMVNTVLSFSFGRKESNIIKDLRANNLSKEKYLRDYFEDLGDFRQDCYKPFFENFLDNLYKNLSEEGLYYFQEEDLTSLTKFENHARKIENDYTQRWIMYNKLFQNYDPDNSSK